MKKFKCIEGLRGWLAWTVVLSHVTFASGIYAHGLGPLLSKAGTKAVLVFVIISGFVITHLIIEKRESYGVYITRRFMRIFPLFAVTSFIGYFTLPLLTASASRLPWKDTSWFTILNAEAVQSQTAFFWQNILAHLTMLHGVISDNVLPASAIVYNPPAWSLSLEWQFYLVAPLALIASRNVPTIASLIVAVLCVAYNFGMFGTFPLPSLLFALAPLFAVGIASRLAYPMLAGSLQYPAITMALLVALIPVGAGTVPFLIWGCIYAALISDQQCLLPADKRAVNIISMIFESRFAIFMGARSYSIYLIHMAVLGVTLYALTSLLREPSKAKIFVMLVPSVFPITFIFACILYCAIEKPGIAIGNLIRSSKRIDAEAHSDVAINRPYSQRRA